MPIRLPPPQILEISGPDAIAFAHAQFSSDVAALAPRHWQWSAWLSAQGRVRAFFRLLRRDEQRLLAILRGGTAADFFRRLAPYVLRAKVRLDVVDPAPAFGCFDAADVMGLLGGAPDGHALIESGGRIGMAADDAARRWLVLGAAGSAGGDVADEQGTARWRATDIAAGIVELAPEQLDRFVAPSLGLERLDAASVRKGCYPGQEIVARLHYKGGNKRWLHRVEFSAGSVPPAGTELHAAHSDQPGELLDAVWTAAPRGIALAVLPECLPGTALTAPSTGLADFRVISAIGDASA